MHSSEKVDELLAHRLMVKEEIGWDQISKLLVRAKKDLTTAERNLEFDQEAAYTFAYLAMLRCGRALMFAKGFRPIGAFQHKTVVEFTGHVLGEHFGTLVKKFDKMRKRRNQFTYNPDVTVSRQEAENALRTATELVKEVVKITQASSPQIELFQLDE